MDLYDTILSHLIEEGYADSYEDANAMMAYMSEEWYNEILKSVLEEGFIELTPEKQKRVERHIGNLKSKAIDQYQELQSSMDKYRRRKKNPVTNFLFGTVGPHRRVARNLNNLNKTKRHLETSMDSLRRSSAGRTATLTHKRNVLAAKLRDLGADPDVGKQAQSNIRKFKRTQNESYAYDFILKYLINEGYAKSYKEADAIIESMSGDWMGDILSVFRKT